MTKEQTLLTIPQLAGALGVSIFALKKYRQRTREALADADQLSSVEPDLLLPANALPLPANHKMVVEHDAPPRYDLAVVQEWMRRTGRLDPKTSQPTDPRTGKFISASGPRTSAAA